MLGTDKHLLNDDGDFSWVDHVPKNAWVLCGNHNINRAKSIDVLARLNCANLNIDPPQKYVESMKIVMKDYDRYGVPWSKVMTKASFKDFMNNVNNEAINALTNFSKDYFMSTWGPTNGLLASLKPALINVQAYEELSNGLAQIDNIKSFKPNAEGYAKVVNYDRFGTRTGRLVVSSGPQILTLKRENRSKLLVSRFKNGSIMYADFSALEVRIALYESNSKSYSGDLYTNLSNDIFDGKVTRDQMKLAIISELYGSSKKSLSSVLEMSEQEVDQFLKQIKATLKTSELKARIKNDFACNGTVTNRYGRKFLAPEPTENILLNTYVQSTGVDVSLLGFKKIVDQFAESDEFVPLFVLHDALIFDCSERLSEAFDGRILSVRVPKFDQTFELKVSKI